MVGCPFRTSHNLTFLSVEHVASKPGAAAPPQKLKEQVGASWAAKRNTGADPINKTEGVKSE